jgi:hypothetical protein
MTTTGKIIRDAWVFELLPATETCKGWKRGTERQAAGQGNAGCDRLAAC